MVEYSLAEHLYVIRYLRKNMEDNTKNRGHNKSIGILLTKVVLCCEDFQKTMVYSKSKYLVFEIC